MLSKQYKLKSNSEIAGVFKNGKTVKSSFLFLRYAAGGPEATRVAFSVGLNYSKKAVDRNRAKRVLRSSYAEFVDKVKSGFDLVFYFDKNFKDPVSQKDLLEPMNSCLIQAKILK